MSVENKWKEEKIGEQLKLLSGFPFSSNKFSTQDGFPLIRIRDVVNSTIETYYLGDVLTMYIIKEGDVLIGMDGDFHIDKWKNRDALLNQRVLKVEVDNPAKLDSEFIFYLLQPYLEKVNEMTAATTVKHLSTNDLRKAKAKIPCLAAQQKIGSVLNTIDRTIAKTEALIEKYQQIKAGLMHDLFTRGIGADGKLRSRREESPELYQESAIGWIPKEWILVKANNVITTIDAGKSPECPDRPASADQWGVLKVSAVSPDGLKQNENKVVEKIEYQNPNSLVKKEDLLITRANTPELVGMICHVKQNTGNLILSDKTLRLHIDTNQINKRYLYWTFQRPETRKQIEIYATGSSGSMKNISQKEIRNILIALPISLDEQSKIKLRLDKTLKKIRREKLVKDKLQKQKSGLMHDLLTGKVSVNVDSDAP